MTKASALDKCQRSGNTMLNAGHNAIVKIVMLLLGSTLQSAIASPVAFQPNTVAVAPANYAAAIRSGVAVLRDSPDKFDVIRSPQFAYIFLHPSNFVAEAELFVCAPSNSDMSRKIAMVSMQMLDTGSLVNFYLRALDCAERGLIPAELANYMLVPPFDLGAKIVKNYRSPEVIGLLKKLKESRILTEDSKKVIDDVLDGTAAAEVREFEDMDKP